MKDEYFIHIAGCLADSEEPLLESGLTVIPVCQDVLLLTLL